MCSLTSVYCLSPINISLRKLVKCFKMKKYIYFIELKYLLVETVALWPSHSLGNKDKAPRDGWRHYRDFIYLASMLATNLDLPVKLTCMSLSCGRNTWKKLIKDHARSLQKQILTKSLAVFVISHVVFY